MRNEDTMTTNDVNAGTSLCKQVFPMAVCTSSYLTTAVYCTGWFRLNAQNCVPD